MSNATSAQQFQEDVVTIEDRIVNVLSSYPVVSPTMLGIMLQQLPAAIWKPILERMVADGIVGRSYRTATTQSGRATTQTSYYLTKNEGFLSEHGFV